MNRPDRKITVAFATHGCRFNQSETEQMRRTVPEGKFQVVSFDQPADVYVINTCAVTEKSEGKCRRTLHRIHRERPDAKLVVSGCASESNCQAVDPFSEADLILGNSEKLFLGEYLLQKTNSGWTDPGSIGRVFVGDVRTHSSQTLREKEWSEAGDPNRLPYTRPNGRTNAYVKVQNGCDEQCTFCIIKTTRGKSRSRDPEGILHEIKDLTRRGVKEIVLTGINLGQYGMDMAGPGRRLSDLLSRIADLSGDFRIRLSSINPNEVTPELIDLIKRNRRFCRHLHIPLQSGSEHVLFRMKRGTTKKYVEQLIQWVWEEIPWIGIGTDILVGFPGEGEREFRETFELLERFPFSHFHVFPYSERRGTEAVEFSDKIPVPVRKERVRVLRDLGQKKAAEFRSQFVGENLKILVETTRDERTGNLKGFSDNYIPCVFPGPDRWMGSVVPGKGIKINPDHLVSEVRSD